MKHTIKKLTAFLFIGIFTFLIQTNSEMTAFQEQDIPYENIELYGADKDTETDYIKH